MDPLFELYAMHQTFDVEPIIEDILDMAHKNMRKGIYNFSYNLPSYLSPEDKDYIENEVKRRLNL